MANPSALLKGRAVELSDGAYLERSDPKESAVEGFLRGLLDRVPSLRSRKSRLRKVIFRINASEAALRELTEAELIAAFAKHCAEAQRCGFTDEQLIPVFSIIREASRRVLGLRHHDVQLMGGWALMQGVIAEMNTGEGKTLVATLAACAAAGSGVAVHVVTVNDYLAERDAEKNGPLYRFFGLSVGVIAQGMSPDDRRKQYACDIVYVSNKEIVFDYLKDRIAIGGALRSHMALRRLYRPVQQQNLLLRGLHMAIVDEADSVLIDEARTPLIISESQPAENGPALYDTAIATAGKMRQGEHFLVTQHREVQITPRGEQHLHALCEGLTGVWDSALWRRELIQKALTALWCFERDQHYIVAEGKVEIVDEFSGRVMPDRSWESGLHQMIEAKEGCEITGQRKTLSRMTYQRFFRRYLLLSGMSGTVREVGPELRRVYELDVFTIPTHRPSRRRRLPDWCSATSEQRWQAVANRAVAWSQQGHAVLVGTRSVEASERLSTLLTARGVAHAVLNARQDREEAETVAQAGQAGRITVATNIAGRGTDILLAAAVSERGGLHVLLTEFHESSRIDRQLIGRCARQGEPGVAQAMVSLEDELFVRYADLLRRWTVALSAPLGATPAWWLKLLVSYAQWVAERRHAADRRATLKQDDKLQSLLAFAGTPN